MGASGKRSLKHAHGRCKKHGSISPFMTSKNPGPGRSNPRTDPILMNELKLFRVKKYQIAPIRSCVASMAEPELKRRRVEKVEPPKKQSSLFAFAKVATPQNTNDAEVAQTKEEWLPRLGEGWCNALLPELRTG